MPELPEVEIVARQLHAALAGKTIKQMEFIKTGREFPVAAVFCDSLQGKKVVRVYRRAKLLVWEFEGAMVMIGHLKMTGRFLLRHPQAETEKHDRARLIFDNDVCVVWQDVRTFGYIKLLPDEQLAEIFAAYGPEPLDVPSSELTSRLTHPIKRRLKSALLNQSVIAGIGNIYADEVCFAAGIRPDRLLGSLGDAERLHIAQAVQEILQTSIAHQGTTTVNYVNAAGGKGKFASYLQVYGRAGEPCGRCSGVIVRTVLGGRGTHWCPMCQK